MSAWVLVIVFASSSFRDAGMATSTIDMPTFEACNEAAKWLRNRDSVKDTFCIQRKATK